MTIKVIGAGFGRNGTLSLKHALEMLDFDKCYHMMEMFEHPEHVQVWRDAAAGRPVDWEALYEGYQASVDWPGARFWQEQMHAFPNAKVILSVRDPERWYESIMNTIYASSVARRNAGDPAAKAGSDMVFEVIWDGTFGGRLGDKDRVIGIYLAHNQKVKDTVPADQLLVYEAAQGWDPLCAFLGCPVPAKAYPRTNSTEDFQQRVRGFQEQRPAGEASE